MKLRTAAALATAGYFCDIDVALSATAESGLADVTDVDVLGVRHDMTFARRAIAASCKSGQRVAVAKEVFYLRGVLNYVRADEGVALFAFSDVPQHLRDLGRQLNVLVLSMPEAEGWRRSIASGVADPGYYTAERFQVLQNALEAGASTGLNEWLEADFWFYQDFRNLSRGVSRLRSAGSKLPGSSDWHSIIFLNTAAHLALTILDLCRTVRMMGVEGVVEKSAAYLFGGVSFYRSRKELYARVDELLKRTGVVGEGGPVLPPLEPSWSGALAELAVRFIERPNAAVLVPQVLQDAMWRNVGSAGLSFEEGVNGIAAQKLADDLLQFLRGAANLPWHPRILKPVSASPGSS